LFSYFGINSLAKKLVPWIADKQLASEASVGKVRIDVKAVSKKPN
jgi:hypothetical protein